MKRSAPIQCALLDRAAFVDFFSKERYRSRMCRRRNSKARRKRIACSCENRTSTSCVVGINVRGCVSGPYLNERRVNDHQEC